jgi:hypothetical protein
MVKFGMDNTFVTFEDQYWIYGEDLPVEEKGLTIGGYESAFFADLAAAYILEKAEDIFDDSLSTKSTVMMASTSKIQFSQPMKFVIG